MAILATLKDDFEDNSTNLTLWPNAYTSSATYAETGGQLVITLAGSTAGSNYCGYNTAPNTYDLTGNYCLVQATGQPSQSTNAQMLMKVYVDANNTLYFTLQNGTLHFQKNVAGAGITDVATVSFNSTAHKWWRLRENQGTIYWDTSPDGHNWNNQTSLVNPFATTALIVEISAGTFQSETTPGSATFDNFNIAHSTGSFSNYSDIVGPLVVGDGMSRNENN